MRLRAVFAIDAAMASDETFVASQVGNLLLDDSHHCAVVCDAPFEDSKAFADSRVFIDRIGLRIDALSEIIDMDGKQIDPFVHASREPEHRSDLTDDDQDRADSDGRIEIHSNCALLRRTLPAADVNAGLLSPSDPLLVFEPSAANGEPRIAKHASMCSTVRVG